MSPAGSLTNSVEHVTSDPSAWDEVVRAGGGHLLQSWRWGAFKDQFGWRTERVAVSGASGTALAQILFKHRAGVSIGYIPRGPVVPEEDPELAQMLWTAIDGVARRRRALTIIAEPNRDVAPEALQAARLLPGPAPIQPSRTVKVELGNDDALLGQMHQKTRYNVRLAQRRGVKARFAKLSEASLDDFYRLLQDTSDRNAFGIHPRAYYGEFLRLFDSDAALIFAEIEGRPVAGAIAAAFGDEAVYMYGASSTKERAHGAGFYIQYEVMRWARDRGCVRYDLWGIPAQDPRSTKRENGDRIAGTSGSDWRGLYEFKTRFGGAVVELPAPLERRYHPLLASLAMRVYRSGIGT